LADPDSGLPTHIEETIRSIADFHAQHHSEATRLQRMVERAVRMVGRPQFIGLLTLVLVGWIAVNMFLLAAGQRAFDPPPFQILQDVGELVALYITVLILIAQQREKKISEHLEHLTLELSILTEKKTAKLIELIEELRRDSPNLPNREDPAAAELSAPADTRVILDALKETQQEALAAVDEGEGRGEL
jgi:uncharacterized membrane protein